MFKRHVLIVLLGLAALAAPAQAASPGAPDLEDQLFPGLGNGGYDVLHYHLDVRYATSAPSQPLDGTVTIVARATQSLSRFDLDFAGDAIGSVAVDGDGAALAARRRGAGDHTATSAARREAVRRARQALHGDADGARRHPESTAFFITPDGSATAPQPDLAHHIFPSNDHPRDKASYSFRIDVPAGEVAIANGVPTGRRTHGGRTVWTYVQRQPMASELLQLAAGRLRPAPAGKPSRRAAARRRRSGPRAGWSRRRCRSSPSSSTT